MDWALARKHMIDGQLRPNRVTDPRLLGVMGTLPRERFVPPALRSRAYADGGVPLPGRRAMTDPMLLARLVQLIEPRADDAVLLLGANSGYAAAVLAGLGARVVAIEPEAGLRALATGALEGIAPPGTVKVLPGDLAAGWPEGAPYAAILIEGAVDRVPDALIAQLAEGGRLATVREGRAVLGRRFGDAFTLTPAFDATASPLPGFAPTPGFAF